MTEIFEPKTFRVVGNMMQIIEHKKVLLQRENNCKLNIPVRGCVHAFVCCRALAKEGVVHIQIILATSLNDSKP